MQNEICAILQHIAVKIGRFANRILHGVMLL